MGISKEKFVDLDLIHKFVKKSKVQELKIKKDIYSTNFVFFFIFIIGFMGVIILFRYMEKQRLEKERKEEEQREEERRRAEERDLEMKLFALPKNVAPRSDLHVRNAVIQNDDQKRNEKEEELRKKFNSSEGK